MATPVTLVESNGAPVTFVDTGGVGLALASLALAGAILGSNALSVAGTGLFTGKQFVNIAGVDSSNRAGALGVAYTAAAYVEGTDPGDANRGISLVGVTAGRPSILNIRNTTDSFGVDFVVDYAAGAGNLHFAFYNHGTYATKATLNDLGYLTVAHSIRTGPGTPNSSNNNYLSVNTVAAGSIDNVLEIQNFARDHYSAIRYMDYLGAEKCALGFGNDQSLAVFAAHSYWESFGGNNDLRIVVDANKGVTWRWAATTGDVGMYADSGSSGTALGTLVLSIARATGNLTSAGTITAGKTATSFTDAATNTVTEIQKLTHLSSGTVAASFGVGTGYYLQNASGSAVLAATTAVYYNNATAGAEGARWRVSLISSGSMNTTAFEVQRDGSIFAAANVTAGAGSAIAFSGRSIWLSSADAQLDARNSANSAYSFIRGKLQTETAATTGLSAGALAGTTNASLTIYDSGGQAYRVPAIL